MKREEIDAQIKELREEIKDMESEAERIRDLYIEGYETSLKEVDKLESKADKYRKKISKLEEKRLKLKDSEDKSASTSFF